MVSVDPLLRWLAVDPALASARQPVHAIVEKLAQALDVNYVIVGELLDQAPEKVRTVAWWKDGRYPENVEYPVAGSPCEAALNGCASYYPANVTRLFPQATFQKAEGIEAYAAHPLIGVDGARLGHIAAMSRRRFKDARRIRRLLCACAPRLAGEVEQLHREDALTQRGAADEARAKRREQQLLDSDRERETLLREVHHRVKASLQIVASLLNMQASATTDEIVTRALSDSVNRISTIALIHAQLSEGPDLASVDVNAFVQSLVRNVQRTFEDATPRISISLSLDPLTLPLQLATPCGLLISEMVTNAYQHAFTPAGSGQIEIRLTADERTVTIVVRDDGPGLPPQAEGHAGRGLGLQLIQLLATKQLRGDVAVAYRDGTEFTVTFPRGTHQPSTDLAPRTYHSSGGQDV